MNKKKWLIPITIVFFLLGIILTIQFQTQTRLASDLSLQKTEHLITMVRNLSDKRYLMASEIETIENKLLNIKDSKSNKKNIMKNIKTELTKLEIINGTLPVKGPGLFISIDENSPIIYSDIVFIINELWAAGAEAISVNDKRITFSSVLFYKEIDEYMYITLNGEVLHYPITIKAIGKPDTLEKGLTIPGGIIDNLALFQAFPYLEQQQEIFIPVVEDRKIWFYAREQQTS